MGRVKLSESVMGILDTITEQFGAVELTAEDSEKIFGGSEATTVKDLTTTQLLQYGLLYTMAKLVDATEVAVQKTTEANELGQQIIAMTRKDLTFNRAQRRAK